MADDAPQEPVSLEQIKRHLDVVRTDQDEMLIGMGIAAREWVESFTGLTLAKRPVTQAFAGFGDMRSLLAWPIADDAVPTVRYVAPGTAPVDVAGATVFPYLRPCPIWPAAGTVWPRADGATVIVTVEAGYATPADVPYSLKAAILLMVGDLYANREKGITGVSYTPTDTLMDLCRPYRMLVIG